jgi:hypothetical protein
MTTDDDLLERVRRRVEEAERALDRLDLAAHPADPGEQLLLFGFRVRHD